MYHLNSNLQHYVDRWYGVIGPLNHDPVRFNLSVQLESRRKVSISPEEFHEALDHLVINAMAAMSGLGNMCGVDIIERWQPEVPGELILRTKDYERSTIVEVEDNGCGINPKNIVATDDLRKFFGIKTDYDAVNHVFKMGVSTKGSNGAGLYFAQWTIEDEGKGRIYVVGTTYSVNGKSGKPKKLVTIGEHHSRSTGTVFRIEFPYKCKK